MIWEIYEIHPTLPSKVSHVGNWNAKQGIQYEEPRKWIRRQNLEVGKIQKCKTIWFLFLSSFQGVKFKILSYQTLPWITVMKKISDGEDAYEFSGPVPDVWFALQVKKNSI